MVWLTKTLSIYYLFVLSGNFAFAGPYIAFGDLRGHIEPCGCNPATDLGGIARIGGFVDLERSRYPELEVYSLGSNFHFDKFNVADEFIELSLIHMKPTAMLFGKTEWINRQQIKKKSKYLLTNNDQYRGLKQVKRFIVTKSNLIFGFLEMDGKTLKKTHLDFLKKKKSLNPGKNVIILYAGTDSGLGLLEHSLSGSVILASNFRPLATEVDDAEKRNEDLLYKGQNNKIKIVPLGGQGVVVSKISRVDLNSLVNTAPCNRNDSAGLPSRCDKTNTFDLTKTMPVYDDFHWLSRDSIYSNYMDKLLVSYRLAAKDSYGRIAKSKLKYKKHSNYVGSLACKKCHPSIYKIYERSAHARAFKTLKLLDQHENESCVGCHVVGFNEKGGFISEKESPHLRGVGCEHCHGPRKMHAQNPAGSGLEQKKKSLNTARNVCIDCHKPPHSSNFDYSNYWPKIAHGFSN